MILRFLQIFLRQRIRIYNHDCVPVVERKIIVKMRLRMIEMRTQCTYLQRRSVHRYDDIRFVTWGIHFAS